MTTERDRLVRTESQIENLKQENKDLWDAFNKLRQDMYGNGPGDKNAIVYQLQSLTGSRAIAIWVVSILSGLGTTVVAAVIISLLQKP